MEKITINSLIIEVTRRCNMECEHCLRGEAQNINISREVIDAFFENNNIEYISNLTFTGGEPSLNVEGMRYFIDSCKNHNVEVGSFYIATNGKQATSEFILFLLELYLFCADNETSRVEVSNSDFHSCEQDTEAIERLKCLSFVGVRQKLNIKYLIHEGRAKNIVNVNRKLDIYPLEIDEYGTIEGELYINCKGDICESCDLSYRRQDKKKIGNVKEPLIYLIRQEALQEA